MFLQNTTAKKKKRKGKKIEGALSTDIFSITLKDKDVKVLNKSMPTPQPFCMHTEYPKTE